MAQYFPLFEDGGICNGENVSYLVNPTEGIKHLHKPDFWEKNSKPPQKIYARNIYQEYL